MTSTAETIHQCPHCEAEVDPEELGGRVYECQNDGPFIAEEGEGNRCPECNKFAAKVADQSCPDCGEAIEDGELEEREVYRSEDGTTHDTAAEAAAWDFPEAVAQREREVGARRARTASILDAFRVERADEVRLLRSVLAQPTSPPIAYYDGWAGAFESVTAFLTPDEIRAVCGGDSDDEVEARWIAAGGHPVGMWRIAVNVGVPINVLCTLLEALASRETS